MKSQVITIDILKEELKQFAEKVDEKARQYRDEILNRMDKDAGELEQIREDQVFINHDFKGHEARIARLEQSAKAA